MPVTTHTITNYEEFQTLIAQLDSKDEKVILYIVGAKKKSGKSWCPDCREVEPVVEEYISSKIKKDVNIVRIELERTYFKDRNNPFRWNSKVRLDKVPTLIYWKDVKRLEEAECLNVDLLDMFFEDFIEKVDAEVEA